MELIEKHKVAFIGSLEVRAVVSSFDVENFRVSGCFQQAIILSMRKH